MGNNLKFNSAICTSREQSERLIALGLRKETADIVHYFSQSLVQDWTIVPLADGETAKNIQGLEIPAWSLHRLLCIIPKRIQAYDEVRRYKRNLYLSIDEDFNIRYEENVDVPCFDKIFWSYDIYQNLIDCIEWLIKDGYFNKEYLV